jgi:phosphopantothenoylcysteine synthetase/decarboxylase
MPLAVDPSPRDLGYLVVTGAATAARAPELVRGLLDLVPRTITILTPNAARVVAARDLSTMDGNTVVESYFDDAILPRPPFGVVLVAPCTFNSLNKLAAGIADSLALSVVAEAIGRGTPVIVAPSVNQALLDHPGFARSLSTLVDWGVSVVPGEDLGAGPQLAPTPAILAAVGSRLDAL